MPTETQLKQQAKRLLAYLVPFTSSAFKYAHCLEAMARVYGARNWNTLLAQVATPAETRSPTPTDLSGYQSILLYGMSGSGKSVLAKRLALEDYAAGKPLVVLDHGRSWFHLMQGLEADIRTPQPNGDVTLNWPMSRRVFNQPRLLELEGLTRRGFNSEPLSERCLLLLRSYLDAIPLTENTTVIAEEQYFAFAEPALRTAVVEFIIRANRIGCRIIVTAQHLKDFADVEAFGFLTPIGVGTRF